MPKVDLPTQPVTGTGSGLIASTPGAGGLVSARPATPVISSGSMARAQVNGLHTPELSGSDFVVLEEPRPQTVGIVYARDGEGKTHFVGAHCPEPVVLIGLDGRGERTAKKVMRETGRKIYFLDAKAPGNAVQMTHEQAQQAGTEALNLITRNFEWAVDKSIKEWGKGTLVFDTSTELRDIVRLAVRGRVDRPNPKSGEKGDFGKSDAVINRTLMYFCNRARDSKLNLILLSRAKPVYEGREDTGRITWDTDKIFSQACDWVLELRMIGGAFGGGGIQMLGMGAGVGVGAPGPTWELRAANPKTNINETGKVYRESDWGVDGPFAFACSRLMPGSQPGDWK